MKIYTVQHNTFLDTFDTEGFLINTRHPENSIFNYENTLLALDWMNKQYEKRIGTLDRDLIWVWPRLSYINYPIPDDYFIYEFEVPMTYFKGTILWSDFYDWHLVLNQIKDVDYEDIFNVNPKKSRTMIQGVTIKLNRSWFKKRFRFKNNDM